MREAPQLRRRGRSAPPAGWAAGGRGAAGTPRSRRYALAAFVPAGDSAAWRAPRRDCAASAAARLLPRRALTGTRSRAEVRRGRRRVPAPRRTARAPGARGRAASPCPRAGAASRPALLVLVRPCRQVTRVV